MIKLEGSAPAATIVGRPLARVAAARGARQRRLRPRHGLRSDLFRRPVDRRAHSRHPAHRRNDEIIAVRNPVGLHHRRRGLRPDVAGGADDVADRRLARHRHGRHHGGRRGLRAPAQDPRDSHSRHHRDHRVARERRDGELRNDDEAACTPAMPPATAFSPCSSARSGFTASATALEGRDGFFENFARGLERTTGAVQRSRQELRPREIRLQAQALPERRARSHRHRRGAGTARRRAARRHRRASRSRSPNTPGAATPSTLSAVGRERQVQRALSRRLYAGARRPDAGRVHRGGAARRGGSRLRAQGLAHDLSGARRRAGRVARQGDGHAQ